MNRGTNGEKEKCNRICQTDKQSRNLLMFVFELDAYKESKKKLLLKREFRD